MSRKPILALTSDWHCQPGAWVKSNTPKGDSFYALRQFYQFCVEYQVDLVGAGDLTDVERPDSETLRRVFSFFDDMRRADRRTFFTTGQHDRATPPYFSLHSHPMHLTPRRTTARGINIVGLDHTPADRLQQAIDALPRGAELLVCHQVWGDFMGYGAEGRLEQLCYPAGPDVVLTGDYHVHKTLELPGRTKVLSPGSTCLQDISEPREKAFFVLYDDLSVDSVPLKTRRVVDFEIRTEDDLNTFVRGVKDDFLEPRPDVPPEMQKNVIYVQCGDVPEAYRRVAKAVGDKAFLFWKSTAETPVTVLDGDAVDEKAARGLDGCLEEFAPEGSPVYQSVLRMLKAADKKAEVGRMAKDYRG